MGSRPITFLQLWPVTDHEPLVDTCPLTKFEDGLNLLHEADDDVVTWLTNTPVSIVTDSAKTLYR